MANHHQQRRESRVEALDTSAIQFDQQEAELFDQIANRTAEVIAQSRREQNKPTQLRKFYDEIIMWHQKVRQHPEKYNDYLPLIKMINAKVAYAKGRNLVDDNFVKLMRHSLGQLEAGKVERFYTFKLFFEAFMGFYKMHKPK